MTELKGEIVKSTIIVGNFNTPSYLQLYLPNSKIASV